MSNSVENMIKSVYFTLEKIAMWSSSEKRTKMCICSRRIGKMLRFSLHSLGAKDSYKKCKMFKMIIFMGVRVSKSYMAMWCHSLHIFYWRLWSRYTQLYITDLFISAFINREHVICHRQTIYTEGHSTLMMGKYFVIRIIGTIK